MEQLKKRVEQLLSEVKRETEKLNLKDLESELRDLKQQMAKPDFWQDRQKAQDLSKREADLARRVGPWQKLQQEISETKELIKLEDSSLEEELANKISILNSEFSILKKELRFQGPFDNHDVILSIYAGAGGTDAQDWAQMLLRMYVRWAESHKLKVKTIDQSTGEEAGIKSATIKISGHSTLRDEPSGSDLKSGDFLYGKLQSEQGVHRLVRLSPFNANNLRQTSFAKVDILPSIDKPSEVELDDKDLKIDVYRAGGHGGQSVNTTDSAVRVTHLPTGVTVAIQNERSQLQNKATALGILRSKLVQLQQQQHVQNLADLKGPNQSAEWGSQIRSYVLHPYKQVKDLRSGYETTDPQSVLDGNLDPFINAWLECP
ncbi:peptide chain release factor 2 [Candidatus Saccharibacteria bacterium]|nr:peptide chain release factor 2 [Candidatus Saccharibacteria bacterium]